MREFILKHSELVVWITALVIIGAVAVLLVQLNGVIPNLPAIRNQLISNAGLQGPAAGGPSVTFTLQKSKDGNSFYVQWKNLPNGTVALNIFRGKTGSDPSTWLLWKTVAVSSNDLANGSANIDLGNDAEDGFSFSVQAVGGPNGGSGNGSSTPVILWTSSSTPPDIINPPPDNNPPPVDEPPAPTPTSTPSSTDNTPPPPSTPSSTPSSTTPGPGNGGSTPSSTTPSGIPYYNPQVQVTAYGTAPGDFSVTRANQTIEIAWQNIPSDVDTISVARSSDSTGPWSTFIIQHDPGTSGSYALGIIDSSVNGAYYYQLTALEGTTTIATYGPAYLAAN